MRPHISVLLPSRGRPDLLQRSITSLYGQADEPPQVEVLVAADPDDEITSQAAEQAGVTAVVAPGRYGYRGLHHYYNLLAQHAAGDWMLLWNDDAIMQTPSWDTIMASYPPGVLSLRTNHGQLNVFPAAHRLLVEAMGHFSLSTHSDTWVHDVATAAGCLHETPIEALHDRYDLTGNNRDQIYLDSQTSYETVAYYGPDLTALRAQDTAKVREAIDRHQTSAAAGDTTGTTIQEAAL